MRPMSARRRPESADVISRKEYLGHLYAGSRFNRWFGLLTAVAAPPAGATESQTPKPNEAQVSAANRCASEE
jgi:hypothetical protein